MKLFLSIDFEEFGHDLKRDLGIWKTGKLRDRALWESYSEISSFLNNVGGEGGKKATFFCTGVIAKQLPDLISEISKDGHEVACHYFFHDEMLNQNIKDVEYNLSKAKDLLEIASGTAVKGFRAPKFKINKFENEQYQAVQKYFSYDSSFIINELKEIEVLKNKLGLNDLEILPIYRGNIAGMNLRLGGTYLKLLPQRVTERLIKEAGEKALTPHIYLHPYEFNASQNFGLKLHELGPLGRRSSLYWYLRQHQWITLGNKTLMPKLRSIIGSHGLGGRLCDNFL